MAKKKSSGEFSLDSLFGGLEEINPLSTTQMDQSDIAKVRDYIDMGNWILNAAVSGSIKKGLANNKIFQFAGESGTGKTYVCLNAIKNAQRLGYSILYIDTESAVDNEMLENFGIDISGKETGTKFTYHKISSVFKLKSVLTKLAKDTVEAKVAGFEIPKLLVILDSIGMIASDKEIEDAMEQNNKADMTRAKGIRSLFRNITSDLGAVGIPMIYTNHVGVNIGGYGDPVTVGGGEGNKYSASVTLCFSTNKITEGKGSEKRQTGVLVKAKTLKNRFAPPIPIEFHIDFRQPFNRYLGVHNHLALDNAWELFGIAKGNILKQKDYDKLKPAEQAKCHPFTPDNSEEVLFFSPKATARNYVIEHLGDTVSPNELFTERIMEPVKDRFEAVISKEFSFGSDELEDEIDGLVDDISNTELDD